MATLIFLITFLTVLVLTITILVKAIRRKRVKRVARALGIIGALYLLCWIFFYAESKYVPVQPGTDVCFDDWCATITKIDKGPSLPVVLPAIPKDSIWIVLHIKMSNQARGIAQTPSEPRVHIIDARKDYIPYSLKGQFALEKMVGKQPGIGARLQLHQSLNSLLVYEIPANTKDPQILIEEGPWITKLLFQDDQLVFKL